MEAYLFDHCRIRSLLWFYGSLRKPVPTVATAPLTITPPRETPDSSVVDRSANSSRGRKPRRRGRGFCHRVAPLLCTLATNRTLAYRIRETATVGTPRPHRRSPRQHPVIPDSPRLFAVAPRGAQGRQAQNSLESSLISSRTSQLPPRAARTYLEDSFDSSQKPEAAAALARRIASPTDRND